MQEVFNAANRSNTAFYTVDPRGLATGEFDISENVGMARSNTPCGKRRIRCACWPTKPTGRAIVNRNDFGRADEADSSPIRAPTISSATTHPGAAGRRSPRDQGPGEALGDGCPACRKGYLGSYPNGNSARQRSGAGAASTRGKVFQHRRAQPDALCADVGGHGAGRDGKTRVTFVWSQSLPSLAFAAKPRPRSRRCRVAGRSHLLPGRAPRDVARTRRRLSDKSFSKCPLAASELI